MDALSDVYREAYYRLKSRTNQLEERLKFLESVMLNFKQRANNFVKNLEETFLNGNQLLVDRGNYYHKYLKMIDTFQEIKLRSKTIEKTLNDAVNMKNDFEQQSLKLQEQILTNKQMETILDEQKKEQHRLQETIEQLDLDIKNTPQYLEIVDKFKKLREVYNRNKKELEDIIIAKQLTDDTIGKIEDQTKISIKKERAWIHSRVKYEKTIEELKNENQQLLKATNAKDNKIALLSREVKRKHDLLKKNDIKISEEIKRFSNFDEEKNKLARQLKVSEQKNVKYHRELLNVKKKLKQYEKIKDLNDDIDGLKSIISTKDAELLEQTETIIVLQQTVSSLRNKYHEKQSEHEKIVNQLKKEKGNAIQANAAAVVSTITDLEHYKLFFSNTFFFIGCVHKISTYKIIT
jgi:chromosome segregation ATPase